MEDRKETLPQILLDYIDALIGSVGTKKVQLEVADELTSHFMDAMSGFEDDRQKEESAKEMIENFGDAKMLGKLIKQGKKRCRPLWQKVLLRSLYTLCALIVLIVFYGVWFFAGKPTLSVDYLAKLNEMTKPAATAGENAWPEYEKAISLYVKPDDTEINGDSVEEIVARTTGKEGYVPFTKLPSEKKSLVAEWLEKNNEAWSQYESATTKDYCFREYTVDLEESAHPMLLSVLLPHLRDIRDLAKMGIWRSEKQLAENRPTQAAQTCLTVIRAGLQWQEHKGTIIEQLIGLAFGKLGHNQLINIAAHGGLSADDLATIQAQLEDIFAEGFPHINLKTELLMFHDTVQHSFTEGGPGGGHILPKVYLQLLDSGDELTYLGAGIVHAGRDKTVALAETLYARMETIVTSPPYQYHAEEVQSAESILEAHGRYRYAFLWALVPPVERVGQMRYRTKALHDATVTILAAKRRQLEKGQLPDTLRQLKAEGYLKQLPLDPFSDGLLTYKKQNDNFILYSAAEDYTDSNGKQNPEEPWGRKEEGGDRLFWPIQQVQP